MGVSLVAIAAVAASMTLARHFGEQRSPEVRHSPDDVPAPLAADLSLDAIRSAGF